MDLIDTHAHLDEEAFATDCDAVIARAVESGLEAVITIGTTADSSRRAVELARQYPAVYAAVGIQPNYAAEAKPGDFQAIEQLAAQAKVVGIGETGLDRYWDYAPLDVQAESFARHVGLSQRLDLPLIVHCRDADADVVSQLRRAADRGPLRGVMHSFCGSPETARACLDLGLHISFSGMLTYKKNDALRALAAEIPPDRLLVETDAPYLAPAPKRGKRNEPAYVCHTLACLAEVRQVTPEAMAEQTTQNARLLFRTR
jgi:TatD DNase family protein